MIVDRIEHWREYLEGSAWQAAFAYLEGLTPDAEEGEVKLQGDDIVARVMSYETRGVEQAVLEAHRTYIDIQTPLDGSEAIEWFPQKGLTVKTPYDAADDVEFYERPGPAPARVDVYPGTFVLLFPGDAHMPQLMTGDRPDMVKKVVVKFSVRLR